MVNTILLVSVREVEEAADYAAQRDAWCYYAGRVGAGYRAPSPSPSMATVTICEHLTAPRSWLELSSVLYAAVYQGGPLPRGILWRHAP